MADQYGKFPGATYEAEDVLKDYKVLLPIFARGNYVLLRDTKMMSRDFNKMIKAINLLARAGWRLEQSVIESEKMGQTMYCFLFREEKSKAAPEEQ